MVMEFVNDVVTFIVGVFLWDWIQTEMYMRSVDSY